MKAFVIDDIIFNLDRDYTQLKITVDRSSAYLTKCETIELADAIVKIASKMVKKSKKDLDLDTKIVNKAKEKLDRFSNIGIDDEEELTD